VVIIGAGLSGLTAAEHIRAASTPERPIEVLIVDKGRSVGGRLATRRIGDATLDHGAQFFTVRSPEFRTAVDRWIDDGIVAEWCRGFTKVDGVFDGYPRYRVEGGMNQLAKHLAAGLQANGVDIVTRKRANAVIPGPDRWTVAYEAATREPDDADAVIATAPVPQTLELLAAGATVLAPEVAAEAEAVSYHKVIGALVALDRSPDLPEPGAFQRPDHPVFSFLADNQAKGISAAPAITFHLGHDLSAKLWDADDDAVWAEIEAEARATIGQAAIVEHQIKRWRYAGPVTPHGHRSLVAAESPGPLVLAGDAFGGSKVEGAFLSGLDAAHQVLDRNPEYLNS
jgi:predicted NAD/FAD-dependent oxidoreductase